MRLFCSSSSLAVDPPTRASPRRLQEDGLDDCDATSTCHGLSFGPRLRCGVERSMASAVNQQRYRRERKTRLEDKLLSDVPASLALIGPLQLEDILNDELGSTCSGRSTKYSSCSGLYMESNAITPDSRKSLVLFRRHEDLPQPRGRGPNTGSRLIGPPPSWRRGIVLKVRCAFPPFPSPRHHLSLIKVSRLPPHFRDPTLVCCTAKRTQDTHETCQSALASHLIYCCGMRTRRDESVFRSRSIFVLPFIPMPSATSAY